MYIKINGVWREISKISIKGPSGWREFKEKLVKGSTSWLKVL